MFLVLIVNLVLQSTLFQNFAIRNVIPNTSIIIIVSMSLLRGSWEGMAVGFVAGMLQDTFFGGAMGYYALFGMITGYFVGKFNKGFYRENYVIPFFLCAITTFIYESCIYLTGFLFTGVMDYGYFLINLIFPEVVYNGVLTIVIYRILFSINSDLEFRERYKRKLFTIKK
ncbi:MAG: rod shape-determining protein MreD [Anaerotignaceae bacterium]